MESKRVKEVSLKDIIFDNAAELFSRKGYGNVSVREIAEACNVTKPALYYHFKSKEALAKSLIDDLIDKLHIQLIEIRDNPSNDPLELFTRLVSAYFFLDSNKPHLIHFMLSQMFTGFESDLGEYITTRHREQSQLLNDVLLPFYEKGLIVKDSYIGFTVMLLGATLMLHLSHIHKDLRELTPELARCVASDILFGFSASNPERRASREINSIHTRVSNLWEIQS